MVSALYFSKPQPPHAAPALPPMQRLCQSRSRLRDSNPWKRSKHPLYSAVPSRPVLTRPVLSDQRQTPADGAEMQPTVWIRRYQA